MLKIGEEEMRALSDAARRRYPATLAAHCEAQGVPAVDARALADQVLALADARGLDDQEDIEALADVLRLFASAGEPAWCQEITMSAAPRKGERLRACLAALAHG